MLYTEETITYLAMLYAELKEYRRRRQVVQDQVDRGDDSDYYRIILCDWDRAIGVTQAKIAREEANATPIQS